MAISSYDNIGKTCPYCQFPIKQKSNIIICSSCKIPHHKECWQENGGCTTFGHQGLSRGEPASENNLGKPQKIVLEKPRDDKITLSISKKGFKVLATVMVTGLLLFGGISLFGEKPDLDGDYLIDSEFGTKPLADLEIGDRLVDPSWKWEFRKASNYTGSGENKHVVWIVVAKDHYDGLDSHVTLLAEVLIGRHAFDNSTDRGSENGNNHWGDSGATDADYGLRPWLNSTGIHKEMGFYEAFSNEFSAAVKITNIPNKDREGNSYTTADKVFIPSTTELGDSIHDRTYEIGTVYPFFDDAENADRIAALDGEDSWHWTRSPDTRVISLVRYVNSEGELWDHYANDSRLCVRPALNMKSEIMVSEIP